MEPSREPVILTAATVALLTTGLQLLVIFGVSITDQQTEAIVAFVQALIIVVGALYARSKVTPV